jgi:hypothetical protein
MTPTLMWTLTVLMSFLNILTDLVTDRLVGRQMGNVRVMLASRENSHSWEGQDPKTCRGLHQRCLAILLQSICFDPREI